MTRVLLLVFERNVSDLYSSCFCADTQCIHFLGVCIRWRSPENATAAVELNTPPKVLPSIDADFFPNIKQLMKIACTQSVTSVECERSISSLRFLKTYLRSSMHEGRLKGLTLLFIHRDIACDVEAVVDEFAQRNPWRLQLCNSLCAD